TGLIDSMGQWVLERACQDARAWINNGGEPLQVSVNLSPVQFAREDLSERVTAALAAAHLDSRHNNIVNIISAFALVRGHSSNHREKHRARYSVQRAPRC